VVLTGCYAEVQQNGLKGQLGVDLLVGNKDKLFIYEKVHDFLEGIERCDEASYPHNNIQQWGKAITGMKGYSRAYLKIQDGCNSSCSYCIVPRARGPEISRPPEEIFDEMRRLESAGYREVVLTGVHIGRYQFNGYQFHNLIDELLDGDGPRIRFSSMEPNEINESLLKTIEGKKRFCRHIHLAVQSGSDRILGLMNRPYDAKSIREVVSLLCGSFPGITVGADFIAGFPDESNQDFKLTETIANECGFGYLHCFSYSDRPGTKASIMSHKIDPKLKSARGQILRDLSNKLLRRHLENSIGCTGEIIVESRKHRPTDLHTGLSDNYLRAVFSGNSLDAGEILKVNYRSCAGEGKYQYLVGDRVDE